MLKSQLTQVGHEEEWLYALYTIHIYTSSLLTIIHIKYQYSIPPPQDYSNCVHLDFKYLYIICIQLYLF